MNLQQVEALNGNEPIMLADQNMALFIRLDGDLLGCQVPGEQDIRWIHCEDIRDAGNGALVEIDDETAGDNSLSNDSISTDFPVQQARLRRLLKEYQRIPEGVFGAATIEATLSQAEVAIASGKVIDILVAYSAMTDIK